MTGLLRRDEDDRTDSPRDRLAGGLLPPDRAVREGELREGLATHLRAVTGLPRGEIATRAGPHRIDEVLVEVVDVLHDHVVERARDCHEVERRQMLHQLAET